MVSERNAEREGRREGESILLLEGRVEGREEILNQGRSRVKKGCLPLLGRDFLQGKS